MWQRWLRFRDLRADAFEKERYWRLQRSGCTHQNSYRDPVGPKLILLNLLKADAEKLAQFPLAHAERLTSSAQTAPNDDIYRITTVFVFARDGPGWAVADR